MSWRVVVVSKRCKLEYKLGYLICRGEETKKIFIKDIDTLLIETTAVSITAALMSMLVENNVNVIFCDSKHNPQIQLEPYYARHDCSGKLKEQLRWDEETKSIVWTEIVRLKIDRQRQYLLVKGHIEQAELLQGYIEQIKIHDITNREGHAAKVYFNAIFGVDFNRNKTDSINSALNYGYTILLSAFNRTLAVCGYNTELGICHKNEFNHFNFSCDLMEPFRVLADRFVDNNREPLSAEYKHALCDILNHSVYIDGQNCTVLQSINIYCKSIFVALDTGDVSKIKCYEL